MKVAYVDTSCLVAIAFGEKGAARLARKLERIDVLISSDLMMAELRSAFAREKIEWDDELVAGIDRVLPDRPLDEECERVLEAGCLRGADLWHVACALYVAPDADMIHFVTLDERQGDVAGELGFSVGSVKIEA